MTLLTDGTSRKWEAAVWSPTWGVMEAAEGQSGSSHIAELSREVANTFPLHWLVDGGKRSVGVAGKVEKGQLAEGS